MNLLVSVLSLPAVASPGCLATTSNDTVAEALTVAYDAYTRIDDQAFQVGVLTVVGQVECLGEPIDPALAASVHRLNGLEAFTHRDLELTEQSFAAARAADGAYRFPDDLVPPGSPILEHYRAIQLNQIVPVDLVRPELGKVYIDGRSTLSRLERLPAVFQRSDEAGTIVDSQLLMPFAKTPAYPVEDLKHRSPAPAGFLVAGLVSGAASLSFFLAARGMKTKLDKDRNGGKRLSIPDAERAQTLVNGFTVANIGFGVAAGGLGATALLVGVF